MARRAWSEAQVTREKILDAAEWCFRTLGVSGTSMESIATRAGCTRGAIYGHFREQTEILHAILRRGDLGMAARIEATTQCPPPVLPALRACLRECLLDIERNEHACGVAEILTHRCDFSGARQQILEVWAGELNLVRAALGQAFERAHRLGELRAGIDRAVCASSICYVLLGGIYADLLQRRVAVLERDAMKVLDFLFQQMMQETNDEGVVGSGQASA